MASSPKPWTRWAGFLAHRGVTSGGALFSTAVVLVGMAAILSANNLLFLVLATMLSVLLVSGLVSRLGLAGLELDFALPEHVCARRTIAATLAVRNTKSWMPSFSVRVGGAAGTEERPILDSEVYFPIIPGGATLEEPVDVHFARRGAYRQNSFLFTTRFPFGFREKGIRVALTREVVVYPSIDPQPGSEELLAGIAGDLEAHARGRGGDFYRIRPYEPLESARHVDWKASAHTRELQVREFSREEEQRVEIFFDRDAPPGAWEWFERAVDCCAFLAWRLSQQGAAVRFCSQDFQIRVPEEGDVYTILKYLALVFPAAGSGPEPPIDDTSFQIVFSSAPERVARAGWTPARVVSPSDLPLAAGGAIGAGETGAGAHVDYGG
ncbi:MAG: DUF58 domain-containing protein [Candidatus Solibacter usitatus]|nr:DUF58 domain-containing protein [Candidatus Solibacter usitatus]